MRRLCIYIAALLLIGCGQSYEETKKQTRMQRIRAAKEDSAALKIAVLPTLDGLPLFVLKELQLYDTAVVDIRLKRFTAQMDCDTALMGTAAEGMMSDVVRVQRLAARGYKMRYMATMNTCWQLISNKNARVRELKQMEDKTIAMTRNSATDLLTDLIVDSVHVKSEHVYRVQVNDVNVRLKMLQNNMLDLLWLTEPQATAARRVGRVLTDSRKLGLQLGVVAFRQDKVRTLERRNQMDELLRAYNSACDSINKYGIARYRNIIVNYCGVDASLVDSLPANIKFRHAEGPLQRDIERADKWLKSK